MIIFLYGEDAFRSGQKLREIKEKFLKSDSGGSGLSVFDYGGEDSGSKLPEVLETPNLLAPQRLVIAKNLIFSGAEEEKEETLKYLKEKKSLIDARDTVLVFWENNLPKKTGKLFKFLAESAKSQDFEKLSGLKLNNWVLKKMKEYDPESKISNSALEKLVAFSGGETQALDSEIKKLINFSNGEIIKDEDVEKLVNANISIKIFDTIDALGANNKKEAARLLHEHLKKGEDPFYLFSMFVYQFRNLLKVADLKENNGSGEYEIAKTAGLHPFVVRKSLAQVRNFTFDKLKNIYRELSELDTKIKTGKIDIRLALDKFIVEL